MIQWHDIMLKIYYPKMRGVVDAEYSVLAQTFSISSGLSYACVTRPGGPGMRLYS